MLILRRNASQPTRRVSPKLVSTLPAGATPGQVGETSLTALAGDALLNGDAAVARTVVVEQLRVHLPVVRRAE